MPDASGLRRDQAILKRIFDLAVGLPALLLAAPVIGIAALLARLETGEPGIFRQQRVGRDGVLFDVQKIRTMRSSGAQTTTVTVQGDVRITRLGRIFRRLKIDELPQLINVVKGDMSLVGPRPDVPGFADVLEGEDRKVLKLRPGITGPAALAYRHEEQLLQSQPDPERYNREVVWPDKVAINRQYVESWSLRTDVHCVALTIRSVFDHGDVIVEPRKVT